MGVDKCYKYEEKANRYQKEKEQLYERIKDLKSVPTNPQTQARIDQLDAKYKALEKKRVETMDQFYECMSAGFGDGDKKK